MSNEWEDRFDGEFGVTEIPLSKTKVTYIFTTYVEDFDEMQKYTPDPREIKEFISDELAKHLSRAVTKERTQLLARVREEVIKEKNILGELIKVGFEPSGFHLPTANAMKKYYIGHQLKKLKELEIISEEGK